MSLRINVFSAILSDPSIKISPVTQIIDKSGVSDTKIGLCTRLHVASETLTNIQEPIKGNSIINSSCGSLSVCSLPLSNSSSSMSSASSGGEYVNNNMFVPIASSSVGSNFGLSRSLSNRHRRKISSESSDGICEAVFDSEVCPNFVNVGTGLPTASPPYTSTSSFDFNAATSCSSNISPMLSCNFCGATFSTLEGHIDHTRCHHPFATFVCNNCNRTIPGEDMLKHIKRCKGIHACPECPVSFSSGSFLKKHIQRVHQCADQCLCNLCGKVLASKCSLQNHMKQHADDSSKEFKCDFCEKNFIQRVHLQLHLDRHHGNKELASQPKNFHCDLCNIDYLFEGSFKHHMSWHRRKENSTKNHKCGICNMEFYSESELLRHSQIHNYSTKFKGNRPFRCSVCNAGFTRQYLAAEHLASVHLDPSQISCIFCGKTYLSNDSLRKHLQAKHIIRENDPPDANGMEMEDFENTEPPSRKPREQISWTKCYQEVEMSGIVDEAINDVIRDGNLKDIFSDTTLFSDSH